MKYIFGITFKCNTPFGYLSIILKNTIKKRSFKHAYNSLVEYYQHKTLIKLAFIL